MPSTCPSLRIEIPGARRASRPPFDWQAAESHQPRPHVHRRPRQHRHGILTMIRLNLSNRPEWLDLLPGLRVLVAP